MSSMRTTQPIDARYLTGSARGETSSTHCCSVFRKRIGTYCSYGNSKATL
jgi:hypothetical protein